MWSINDKYRILVSNFLTALLPKFGTASLIIIIQLVRRLRNYVLVLYESYMLRECVFPRTFVSGFDASPWLVLSRKYDI